MSNLFILSDDITLMVSNTALCPNDSNLDELECASPEIIQILRQIALEKKGTPGIAQGEQIQFKGKVSDEKMNAGCALREF